MDLCMELCKEYHEGQFRRDGKTPYSDHPIAVGYSLCQWEEKCVAYLHDCLEDCEITYEDLIERGVDGTIAMYVGMLTHQESIEKYEDYIRFIKRESVRHKIKEMIDSEDPNKILSDDKIAAILNASGMDVARRTVAKYRESLNLGSSVQRRREKSAPK